MEQLGIIRQIEQMAANTWPAPVVQQLGDWRLRAANGVTKRANSVFTSGRYPDGADWMREATSFYERRGLPVCFQISDGSPEGLDDELERQGYAKLFPCSVLIADALEARQAAQTHEKEAADALWSLCLLDAPDAAWMDRFIAYEQFGEERRATYDRIFASIGPVVCFATLLHGPDPVAVGTVTVERGWAGFTNIAVSPAHRGRGAGLRMMRLLIDWSVQQQVRQLYLQVVDGNEPANRLYAKLGFRRLYRFHYRIAPQAGS